MARPLGERPPHGTRRRYQLRGDPCSCAECRAANALYVHCRRKGVTHLEPTLPSEYLEGWVA